MKIPEWMYQFGFPLIVVILGILFAIALGGLKG